MSTPPLTPKQQQCKVEDINLLASEQFKAKSKELVGLSATQLCSGDCKVFKLKGSADKEFKIGFAVVETTDDAVSLDLCMFVYEFNSGLPSNQADQINGFTRGTALVSKPPAAL